MTQKRFVLDDHPKDNGAYHSFDDWHERYHKEADVMCSAADFYAAAKQGSAAFLKEFQINLERMGIGTSSLLQLDPCGLSCKIVTYVGSSLVPEGVEKVMSVPVFNSEPVFEAVTGLNAARVTEFLQKVFKTKDCPEDIVKILEKLCGRKTLISTPNVEERERFPERRIVFYSYEDHVSMDCRYLTSFQCRSWPLREEKV